MLVARMPSARTGGWQAATHPDMLKTQALTQPSLVSLRKNSFGPPVGGRDPLDPDGCARHSTPMERLDNTSGNRGGTAEMAVC